MNINGKIRNILHRAENGKPPSKEECVTLLECNPVSSEASLIRLTADQLSRMRYRNEGIILGQIGIEIDACPGKCKFCSFGEEHTGFTPIKMTQSEIIETAGNFTESRNLFALFLMTMHNFGFDELLEVVHSLREKNPHYPQIVVNIGDFCFEQAKELKNAGVNGAYHVCRLREGIDTALDPEERKQTIVNIRESGLDWYYCCEPVGPEHSAEEIAEQIFLGIEYGCFQHAAMRRVYVPDSPLAPYGQITELRLALVTAVVALASLGCPETKNIAVHEPNLIGLTSGANVVYAETGANPRDTEENTSLSRGRDINSCKKMLYESGFENLMISKSETISLTEAYKES